MTTGGRARNSLDSVLIWPYLGVCSARALDVPALLVNQPNKGGSGLEK